MATEAQIEAAAKAICLANGVDPNKMIPNIPRLPAFARRPYIPRWIKEITTARAALEAAEAAEGGE